MTRTELERLKFHYEKVMSADNLEAYAGRQGLRLMILGAEREAAAEDAHHDALESKDRPINLHQQAAE